MTERWFLLHSGTAKLGPHGLQPTETAGFVSVPEVAGGKMVHRDAHRVVSRCSLTDTSPGLALMTFTSRTGTAPWLAVAPPQPSTSSRAACSGSRDEDHRSHLPWARARDLQFQDGDVAIEIDIIELQPPKLLDVALERDVRDVTIEIDIIDMRVLTSSDSSPPRR